MELESAQVTAFVGGRLGGEVDGVERIGYGEWSTAQLAQTRRSRATRPISMDHATRPRPDLAPPRSVSSNGFVHIDALLICFDASEPRSTSTTGSLPTPSRLRNRQAKR